MKSVRAAKQSLRQQEQQHQYETLGNRSAVLKWQHGPPLFLNPPSGSQSVGPLAKYHFNELSQCLPVDDPECRGPLVVYIFIELVLRHCILYFFIHNCFLTATSV